MSLHTALLIVLKQLHPEHTVRLFANTFRMRIKHFPFVFLLLNLVSALLLGTDTALILVIWSFLTAWSYLRFFKTSPLVLTSYTGGDVPMIRGDASDAFAFADFVPAQIRPANQPLFIPHQHILLRPLPTHPNLHQRTPNRLRRKINCMYSVLRTVPNHSAKLLCTTSDRTMAHSPTAVS